MLHGHDDALAPAKGLRQLGEMPALPDGGVDEEGV
jgi:hypothetical protein